MTTTNRRRFLQTSSSFLAGLGFAGSSNLLAQTPTQRAAGANERILAGFIGIGGQGRGNLGRMIRDTIAVCDVDRNRLNEARDRVIKSNGGNCEAHADYRRLLDNKGIDAVVVSTPDHWHALTTINACQARKHVYCEKPLTLTIAEGRAMVRAARENRVIVQTGSQQRSDPRFRLACELVRSGRLGRVHTVRVGIPGVNFSGNAVPNSEPPAELNYDLWLGPAPQRPYNANRVHYKFRFFWDYSGGQITNWGAHHLDIAQWGLGMDDSGPVTITGRARFHTENLYEVPQWFDVVYTYANGVRMLCGQDYRQGTLFEGEKGSIFVTRGRIESTPPEIVKQPLGQDDVHLYVSGNHHANWLECIRTGRLPICDVEIGHRSATVCHLGNMAIRSGRTVRWDPAKETVLGDAEVAQMMHRPYREPWRLPYSG